MATTLGCTECHDHKYDPFTSRDFYSLGAFFADLSFSSRYGSYSDDRTGSYGGVGFGYDFSNNASVGLNYTHFRVAGSDVNALSVNGEWRF